jgi:cyclomaltodextrinase / maltogenic alpha-amylase / neopullulanase
VAVDSFTPEWARHAVWYQILPERFCNGDAHNDPTPLSLAGSVHGAALADGWQVHPWTSDWYRAQPWERNASRAHWAHAMDRRYGGDLAGILAKLDYLQDLGVNALYLNPVFDAPSHHKYDGSSWHHVDVHFGPDPAGDRALIARETPDDPQTWQWTAADRLLLELIDALHRRGMRVILDGVFNHVGVQHFAFRDVLAHGRASRFADWLKITRWHDDRRFDCESWRGHASLPELRQQDDTLAPGPLKYLEAITRRWMAPGGDASRGIDGWRLDVTPWLPHRFWRDWRALVKSIKPDAYLVAEIIRDVDFNTPYLQGDEFDAVMNYNFAFACDEFFFREHTRISASTFDARLRVLREAYPACVAPVMQNLFGSHDTARAATHAMNRDRFDYRDFDGSYHPRDSRADRADVRAPVRLLPDDRPGRTDDLLRRRGRHVGCQRPVLPQADGLARTGVRRRSHAAQRPAANRWRRCGRVRSRLVRALQAPDRTSPCAARAAHRQRRNPAGRRRQASAGAPATPGRRAGHRRAEPQRAPAARGRAGPARRHLARTAAWRHAARRQRHAVQCRHGLGTRAVGAVSVLAP